jgi:hypothetical protein
MAAVLESAGRDMPDMIEARLAVADDLEPKLFDLIAEIDVLEAERIELNVESA